MVIEVKARSPLVTSLLPAGWLASRTEYGVLYGVCARDSGVTNRQPAVRLALRASRPTRGAGPNWRSALHGLFAAAAATVAGGALLRADDASARRRRKKTRRGGGQTQTLPIGARCESSSQCPESYLCQRRAKIVSS
jgi:hypothetical protein